ncbi:MAG: hypothetical protein LBS02_12400 [Hungatella sp.]|jgi:hypothetical protein|nr:hypothetical protein [Hungatella sp.]
MIYIGEFVRKNRCPASGASGGRDFYAETGTGSITGGIGHDDGGKAD